MTDTADARVTVIPVTPDQAKAIRLAWTQADLHIPLFLVTTGQEYLVEGPEERWDAVLDDDEHSCLRVFTDYEDADTYCELQRENYGLANEECQVVRATLEQLFGLLEVIQSNSIADYDATARIDICSMREDEFPKCIDTLFCPTAYIH